jgi:hypothetical protein
MNMITKSDVLVAAAIISAAGTSDKNVDAILGNFFKVLSAIEAASKGPDFPQVASFQSLDGK